MVIIRLNTHIFVVFCFQIIFVKVKMLSIISCSLIINKTECHPFIFFRFYLCQIQKAKQGPWGQHILLLFTTYYYLQLFVIIWSTCLSNVWGFTWYICRIPRNTSFMYCFTRLGLCYACQIIPRNVLKKSYLFRNYVCHYTEKTLFLHDKTLKLCRADHIMSLVYIKAFTVKMKKVNECEKKGMSSSSINDCSTNDTFFNVNHNTLDIYQTAMMAYSHPTPFFLWHLSCQTDQSTARPPVLVFMN